LQSLPNIAKSRQVARWAIKIWLCESKETNFTREMIYYPMQKFRFYSQEAAFDTCGFIFMAQLENLAKKWQH
jgi:hypothetical protein